MQYFGIFETMFDEEFLTSSYFYINKEGEELSPSEFRELIKNTKLKKENIAGTIFMYNPYIAPKGYDEKKSLASQDFEFGDLVELKIEREMTLFKASIKEGYEGKVIEVRNLFNLNTHKIDSPETLIFLNSDIEKLHTFQLTRYYREMNYLDINNLTINGKFIFFAWGNKLNQKEFANIFNYAQAVYDKCVKTQKKIAFIYRKSTKEQSAIEKLHFLYPYEQGKHKNALVSALTEAFKSYPPKVAELNDTSR